MPTGINGLIQRVHLWFLLLGLRNASLQTFFFTNKRFRMNVFSNQMFLQINAIVCIAWDCKLVLVFIIAVRKKSLLMYWMNIYYLVSFFIKMLFCIWKYLNVCIKWNENVLKIYSVIFRLAYKFVFYPTCKWIMIIMLINFRKLFEKLIQFRTLFEKM